jgi:hypothetical protein
MCVWSFPEKALSVSCTDRIMILFNVGLTQYRTDNIKTKVPDIGTGCEENAY